MSSTLIELSGYADLNRNMATIRAFSGPTDGELAIQQVAQTLESTIGDTLQYLGEHSKEAAAIGIAATTLVTSLPFAAKSHASRAVNTAPSALSAPAAKQAMGALDQELGLKPNDPNIVISIGHAPRISKAAASTVQNISKTGKLPGGSAVPAALPNAVKAVTAVKTPQPVEITSITEKTTTPQPSPASTASPAPETSSTTATTGSSTTAPKANEVHAAAAPNPSEVTSDTTTPPASSQQNTQGASSGSSAATAAGSEVDMTIETFTATETAQVFQELSQETWLAGDGVSIIANPIPESGEIINGQKVLKADFNSQQLPGPNSIEIIMPTQTAEASSVPETTPTTTAPTTVPTAPSITSTTVETSPAQATLNAKQQEIIDSLSPIPESDRQFLGTISANVIAAVKNGSPVNPEVVIAQSIVESGWGRSSLAAVYHNPFGMKAGSNWTGSTVELPTTEYINGKYVPVMATWKVFSSYEDAIADYGKFIASRPWFADAVACRANPETYLEGLEYDLNAACQVVSRGQYQYATDPNYVPKLLSFIKSYRIDEIVAAAS